MKTTRMLTAITMAAVIASGGFVLARLAQAQTEPTPNVVLVAVPHSSQLHQESHGWQYFSDPRAVHAVVISPSGEYFLSLGDGLRQVTGPAGSRLIAPSAQKLSAFAPV